MRTLHLSMKHLALFGNTFSCHSWGEGCTYCHRPGMLLNTLLCTRRSPPPHNKGLFSYQVSVALKMRIPGLNESVPSRILAHCAKDHISSKSQNFHKNKRRILEFWSTCIPMTDPCGSTAETNTTLLSSFS